MDNIFNPRTNSNAPAIVIPFAGARRSLKLNETQAQAMMDITGKENFTDWKGARITLTLASARSGKKTINISKA